jgi:CRP/FNR family transcriptional regulator, cyclic AMP receptor protein
MNGKNNFASTIESRESGRLPSRKRMKSIIGEHPFLRGMSSEHLEILAEAAMPLDFDAGEVIFRKGDPANRFYLIVHGKVQLEVDANHPDASSIQTVGDGGVLGWSWLAPPYLWHFEAKTVEPTESIFFYATPLREECETNHGLRFELLKRTSELMMGLLQATRQELIEPRRRWNRNATWHIRRHPLN